jgi:hypothetical protein
MVLAIFLYSSPVFKNKVKMLLFLFWSVLTNFQNFKIELALYSWISAVSYSAEIFDKIIIGMSAVCNSADLVLAVYDTALIPNQSCTLQRQYRISAVCYSTNTELAL